MIALRNVAANPLNDDVLNKNVVRERINPDKILLILDPAPGADLDALNHEYKKELQRLLFEKPKSEKVHHGPLSSEAAAAGLEPPHRLPKPIKRPLTLTPRQLSVLALIAQGMSNKEIARELHLAEGTIKIHVAALFGKLGVRRRAAVAMAGSRFISVAERP